MGPTKESGNYYYNGVDGWQDRGFPTIFKDGFSDQTPEPEDLVTGDYGMTVIVYLLPQEVVENTDDEKLDHAEIQYDKSTGNWKVINDTNYPVYIPEFEGTWEEMRNMILCHLSD